MFEKQRLSSLNVSDYLGYKVYNLKIIPQVPCLLQNDYGKDNDCTLTSITTVLKYYKRTIDIQDIYNTVETIAKVYGYTGFYGTPNISIKAIYNKLLNKFNIPKKVKEYLFKNIGFTFEKIQNEIDKDNLVLLNLWKDGRNYYKNHTVLIVGYLQIEDKKLLAVYDNWNYGISYIDYNLLSKISSIHILVNK